MIGVLTLILSKEQHSRARETKQLSQTLTSRDTTAIRQVNGSVSHANTAIVPTASEAKAMALLRLLNKGGKGVVRKNLIDSGFCNVEHPINSSK
jgi:hypothetical protein